MAVRRRAAAALARAKEAPDHTLRHPMLKLGSYAYMAWLWLKDHPGSSWAQLRAGTGVHPQVISDMIAEGLIETNGVKGPKNQLRAAEGRATGRARDQLEIEVTVYRNVYGEYSVRTVLLGEMIGAADPDTQPMPVMAKSFKLRPPKPNEPVAIREVMDLQTFAAPQASDERGPAEAPLTLDGEYTIIEG